MWYHHFCWLRTPFLGQTHIYVYCWYPTMSIVHKAIYIYIYIQITYKPLMTYIQEKQASKRFFTQQSCDDQGHSGMVGRLVRELFLRGISTKSPLAARLVRCAFGGVGVYLDLVPGFWPSNGTQWLQLWEKLLRNGNCYYRVFEHLRVGWFLRERNPREDGNLSPSWLGYHRDMIGIEYRIGWGYGIWATIQDRMGFWWDSKMRLISNSLLFGCVWHHELWC